MHHDHILEEAWKIKDANAARYGCDIRRMAQELKEEEEESGRKVVSFEPQRVPAKPSKPASPA